LESAGLFEFEPVLGAIGRISLSGGSSAGAGAATGGEPLAGEALESSDFDGDIGVTGARNGSDPSGSDRMVVPGAGAGARVAGTGVP
jgi:hypothetical protein